MPRAKGQLMTLEEVQQGDRIEVVEGSDTGTVFRVVYAPLKVVTRTAKRVVRLHGEMISESCPYMLEGPPETPVRFWDEFPTSNRNLIYMQVDQDRLKEGHNA